MSDSLHLPDVPPGGPRRHPLIPVLLVAFPVGLILGGAISFIFYFRNLERAKELAEEDARRSAETLALLRKDPAPERIEAYVRLLAVDVGPRNAGAHRERLRVASRFLEGSLGGINMGYEVAVEPYGDGKLEDQPVNLIVEVPGQSEDVVLLCAEYGTADGSPGADDNASGVAVLLSVANAFVGTSPEKTLRFAFFPDRNGADHHASQAHGAGTRFAAVVALDRLGLYSDAPGSQKPPPGLPAGSVPDTGHFLAVLGNTRSFSLLSKVAEGLGAGSLPVETMALPDENLFVADAPHAAFWRWNTPAVVVTATGPLRGTTSGTAEDKLETLDLERLYQTTISVQKLVANLVGDASPAGE